MTINIAVRNQSTNITSAEVITAIADINSQLSNEFYAAWGVQAKLYVPTGSPASSDYQLILLDNYTQSSVLGYHELAGSGTPIGYVFYENSVTNSTPWTVAASHECLEMLMDPNCNLSVATNYSPYQAPNGSQEWLFAFEICDAVQNVALSYTINSTTVSNFVYPAWFQSSWGPFETQFDFQWWLYEPFQLGDGGAVMTLEVGSNQGWQELYGDIAIGTKLNKPIKPIPPMPKLTPPPAKFRPMNKKVLSRRTRRLTNRKSWKRSTK